LGTSESTTRDFELTNSLSSAREAREIVRHALQEAGWTDGKVDDACMVTSEVVTNAVVHGGGVQSLQVALADDVIRVVVADRSCAMPVSRPVDPHDIGGRGLMVVDALCDAWGAEEVAGAPMRKQVWFELTRRVRP
jgi:anti-sigma regulatory factor (Ser/Thr protein kinase)